MTTFSSYVSDGLGSGTPADMTEWDLSAYATGTILTATSTQFTIRWAHHVTWNFYGTGITYDANGFPDGGAFHYFDLWKKDYSGSVEDFSMSFASFNAFLATKDVAGFQQALFAGHDTVDSAYHALGYGGNDTLSGVIAEGGDGDDTISAGQAYGGAGNDTIFCGFASPTTVPIADSGDDNDFVTLQGGTITNQIAGGNGVDTLSLDGFTFGSLVVGFATFDAAALASLGFEKLRVSGYLAGDATTNVIDFSAMPFDPLSTPHIYLDGGDGNDVLVGLPANANIIRGGAGDDTVTGGSAADELHGDIGNDMVYAGAGNDMIYTALGNDSVDAGDGDDTVILETGTVIGEGVWSGGSGTDAFYITQFDIAIDRAVFKPAKLGFEQIRPLYGLIACSDSDNIVDFSGLSVVAGAGDDLIVDGGAGDDRLTGLRDNPNSLTGGEGNDKIYGGRVIDYLSGGDGNDLLVAGAGDDHFSDAGGTNHIKCGGGDDVVQVSGGDSIITGGAGADGLGTSGAGTLYGGLGGDGLYVGGGGVAYGGKGNDSFHLGAGVEALYGESGNDTFNTTGGVFTDTDVVDGGIGNDSLYLEQDAFLNGTMLVSVEKITTTGIHLTTVDATVAAGATITVIADSPNGTPALVFDGSLETDGRFSVTGTVNADTMAAGAGDDQLSGDFGDDTLTGGLGADNLIGGQGADLFVYTQVADSTGSAFDLITLNPDDGSDFFGLPLALDGIDATINSGTLNAATFNSDMAAIVNAARLGAHHALVLNPNGGDFSGSHFIIVDANNVAGYQSDEDFVIQVSTAVVLTGGVGGNSSGHAHAQATDFGVSVLGI